MLITQNIRPEVLIAPGPALTATTKSLVVDRFGFGAIAFLLDIGGSADPLDGANNWTPTIQASDTGNDADFVTVDSSLLQYAFTAIKSSAATNTMQRAEYTGTQRYLRVVLTAAGTVNLYATVTALLGSATVDALTAPATGQAAT